MRINGIIPALLLFMKCTIAQEQVLTLDSVFSAIEKNHPELRMYDNRVKAYDTFADGALSLDPPQFGTGFSMTPYNPMYWRPGEMSATGMGAIMISGQQMFTNRGKRVAGFEQMKSMSGIEMEMKNVTRNEMFGMARMAYYEWIILEKKRAVYVQSEKLLKYLLLLAEVSYAYGMDKMNSYYKAKGMLGDIQAMQLMTAGEIEQKRIRLNVLMAKEASFVFQVDTGIWPRPGVRAAVDSAELVNVRSDYRLLNQQVNALLKKQRFERSKRLPDFGFKYDHMLAFGTQPQQFSFMAMITIPIAPWSSKMYKRFDRGLDYEIASVRDMQKSLLLSVKGNLADLAVQILYKQKQVDVYENTILPSMKKNYELAVLAYEQNKEELFMVLDAFQNFKMAQLTKLDLQMEISGLQAEYEKQLEVR